MARQHGWLAQHGFAIVETGAQLSNKAMAELNLRCGFREVGTRVKDEGQEIIYQKRL